MYSIYQRGSSLCSYLFNFTVVLLALICALSYTQKTEIPKSNLIFEGNSFIPKTNMNAVSFDIRFTPNIDLTNQFHLNVKQIFFYLIIHYDDTNSDIVWSTLVKRDTTKSFMKKEYQNYPLPMVKPGKYLFELRGCVFPFVGFVNDVLYEQKTI